MLFALHSYAYTVLQSELGCDIFDHLISYGDVKPVSPVGKDVVAALSPVFHKVLDHGHIPLTLGGDHSGTYSVFRAMASHKGHAGPVVILHLDAHPDLYENFEDNTDSHASPFARICEDKLCSKLISVGIRTLNCHQSEQASRYGVKIVEARHCPQSLEETATLLRSLIAPTDQVYISLDLDVLDPAYAPGVSHREPGGLSTRQALNFVQSCPGQVIGMDLVEYNHSRDVDGITAITVAKLVKELIGRAVVGPPPDCL